MSSIWSISRARGRPSKSAIERRRGVSTVTTAPVRSWPVAGTVEWLSSAASWQALVTWSAEKLNEPLLGIFSICSQSPPVPAQGSMAAQRGNVVSFCVGDRRARADANSCGLFADGIETGIACGGGWRCERSCYKNTLGHVLVRLPVASRTGFRPPRGAVASVSCRFRNSAVASGRAEPGCAVRSVRSRSSAAIAAAGAGAQTPGLTNDFGAGTKSS